jgi:hypothetical protein
MCKQVLELHEEIKKINQDYVWEDFRWEILNKKKEKMKIMLAECCNKDFVNTLNKNQLLEFISMLSTYRPYDLHIILAFISSCVEN